MKSAKIDLRIRSVLLWMIVNGIFSQCCTGAELSLTGYPNHMSDKDRVALAEDEWRVGCSVEARHDYPGAIKLFEACIKCDPNNPKLQLSLEHAKALEKDAEELLQFVESKVKPNLVVATAPRLGLEDDVPHNFQSLAQAVRKDPFNARYASSLGDIYGIGGDCSKAFRWYTIALSLDPSNKLYKQQLDMFKTQDSFVMDCALR